MRRFVWQRSGWPAWRWDDARLLGSLARARLAQGRLLGKVAALGLETGLELRAEVLTEETVQTAAIEGESLSRAAVRSSVARRLGLDAAGLPPVERRADALVQVLLDATGRAGEPLTAERLKGWQAALFPTGYSGLRRIQVGDWRRSPEPMQVVSGPRGREHIHYQAPPATRLAMEMKRFLAWWEAPPDIDGILRAAVAHVWFLSVHPFEDGNGRIARALADMALAADEGGPCRYYSMSAQIVADREAYYAILEHTQEGDGELSEWLVWFLSALERAVETSESSLDAVLARARFWQRHAGTSLNERQRKVLVRLLDAGPEGFAGGLTTRKYAAITRASRATAQREIAELVERGLLRRLEGGGRSTSYGVVRE